MKRQLLTLIAAFAPFAAHPALRHVGEMETCKGTTSSFTGEMTIEYRSRGGRERSENAQQYFENPRLRAACGRPGRSSSEDEAQALVAADLLSRTRDVVLERLDATRKELEARKNCINDPNHEKNPNCAFVKTTREQMLQMRAALALSQMNWLCAGDAGKAGADHAAIQSAVQRCLRDGSLSHPKPFLAFRSSAFGNMSPLTEAEKQAVSAMVADEIMKYRSAGRDNSGNLANSALFRDHFQALQRAAEVSYQAKIAQNPLLRYIEGPGQPPSQWAGAIGRADQAMKEVQDELKGKPLRDFNRFPWAVEEALKDAPAQFRGDYCFVADHVIEEHKLIGKGRDFLLNTAMLGLGFGAGGIGARALMGSGLAATLAGGSWVQGSLEYEAKMRECVANGACQQRDIEAAKSVVALDYMAVGAFGVGAGARLISRTLASSPDLAAQLARMSPAARADAEKSLAALATNQCR